ncbi:MAG: hypothetical protein IKB20_02175 [Clostridia bacterium]|nr:hypothetical protein [Clostridia bacterium]
MRIIDEIKKRFFLAGEVINWWGARPWFDNWGFCKHKFSEVIWYNICDILTDLIEDVKLQNEATTDASLQKYIAFKVFVYTHGKQVLQRLFDDGYVVIGYDFKTSVYWQMRESEYDKISADDATIVRPKNPEVRAYVMKSSTYVTYSQSDRIICKGFLDFLDDVLNASATVSKRLGAVVVASPKNLTNAPTPTVLTDEQKEKIEKEMREDYGALSNQSNIMLLPREMSWQVINLAGLELRMQEKVKTAILAIVDRIKIPANQVAIIDAQGTKQLANGSEIREGDKLKYKTFRRLFERTFVDMAREYGIRISYQIDGEPIGESSQVVAQ